MGFFVLFLLGTLVPLSNHSCADASEVHYNYKIVDSYPHDVKSYTQGLALEGDIIFESTGHYGRSSVRRIDLRSGRLLSQRRLDSSYFGEGLTIKGEKLFQLTWREGKAFVYDKRSLVMTGSFTHTGEGWGIAYDGKRLVVSDGTAFLRFLNPDNFCEERRLEVRDEGGPLTYLNELEYVDGYILANIWRSDRIAMISPVDGRVKGWVDIAGLRLLASGNDPEAVANGIAYDSRKRRLVVTGKLWAKIFEIRLVE